MLLSVFISHLTKLRWLDELGVSAAMEQDIVCKQTFIGSHYAMLDSQYNPLPVSSVEKKKGLQGTQRSVYITYVYITSTAISGAISTGFVQSIATIVNPEQHSEWIS